IFDIVPFDALCQGVMQAVTYSELDLSVVGELRFVAKDRSICHHRLAADVAAPADDGVSDHGTGCDPRMRPDHGILDDGSFFYEHAAAKNRTFDLCPGLNVAFFAEP